MARTLTPQLPHDVALGAPRGVAAGGAPLLLQRSDGDFIDAVLDEITSAEGRARSLGSAAKRPANGDVSSTADTCAPALRYCDATR